MVRIGFLTGVSTVSVMGRGRRCAVFLGHSHGIYDMRAIGYSRFHRYHNREGRSGSASGDIPCRPRVGRSSIGACSGRMAFIVGIRGEGFRDFHTLGSACAAVGNRHCIGNVRLREPRSALYSCRW